MIGFTRLGYQGFLGNQLFQYAMLKGVAAHTGYKPEIPKRYKFIPEQTAWNQMGWVQLEFFNINCDSQINHVYTNRYEEKSFAFDEGVFSVLDNTDFQGYYQSEMYFKHIEDQIREEFTFAPIILNQANEFLAFVKKQALSVVRRKIVSLHVRRGTYLKPPHTHTHRIMPREYYDAAMGYFPGALFLVFSDDIDWCKKEFKGPQFLFCETGNQWTDMAIMSHCDHHIIAASTFSWWGAWLNPHKEKKVIAPKIWFGPTFSHFDTKDLIPVNWLRI